MSAASAHRRELVTETYLARRLAQLGSPVDLSGVTSSAIRRARFRQAIVAGGLAHVIAGTADGKPKTFAQAFERLYGVPLDTTETEYAPMEPSR